MFLKPIILKKLMKEAHKANRLTAAGFEDRLYLSGGYWELECQMQYIPKVILAQLVELFGKIPLPGECLKINNGENEDTHIQKKIDGTPFEDEIWITDVIIVCGRVAHRVAQDPYTGKIMLIQNRIVDLIDETAIEENKGEGTPLPVLYNKCLGFYWQNNVMKFRVMYCENKKAERIIKHLEQISLTE